MGATVRAFIHAYRDEGRSWLEAGQPSAGNGALMRIAPTLVPQVAAPSAALWADVALAAALTHNDRASTGACLAFVDLLWRLIGATAPPDPGWWVGTFCASMAALEGETTYRSRTPHLSYSGPIWRFVREQVGEALGRDIPVVEACERWYSGAYLLETIPCALYVLARHGDDPESAIVRAVNDTRDNDT